MSFCTYCADIPADLFSFKSNEQCHHNHQPSYKALVHSASSGCQLCQLFVEAVKLYKGPYAASGKWSEEDPIILCSTKFDGQQITSKWHQIGTFRSREIPKDWNLSCSFLDKPGEHQHHSKHEAEVITHWASQCVDNHTSCTNQSTSGFMPSRVIDVEADGARSVKLVNTKDGQFSGSRYLALSHCWGLSMPDSARTVTSNLRQHQEQILLEDLTPTFRDFIQIARSISIRYGWIDSLCIIQDSADDWQREAAQMASVYSAAYLTIAASGSANGYEGCKVANPERSYGPVDLTTKRKSAKDTTDLTKDQVHTSFRIWTRSPTPVSIKADPLTKRGWTLQEQRELSSRLVHYSRDSIRWECSNLNASLEFPWHDRNAIGEERVFDREDLSSVSFVPEKRCRTSDAQTRDYIFDTRFAWKNLVQRYTSRRLTYQADVFPALSGIAQDVARRMSDQYVAGLWKSYFLEGLLWASDWHVSRSLATHSRPRQYLAPTWSWASIQGPISYPSWVMGDRRPVQQPDPYFAPEILKIDHQPKGADTFGAVKDAKVHMRGRLKVAFTKHEQYSMAGNQDRLPVLSTLRDANGRLGVQKVGEVRYDIPLCKDCAADGSMSPIFILCCLHGDKLNDGQSRVFGLALKHASDMDPMDTMQTFRRVGLVWGMTTDFWHQAPMTTAELTLV